MRTTSFTLGKTRITVLLTDAGEPADVTIEGTDGAEVKGDPKMLYRLFVPQGSGLSTKFVTLAEAMTANAREEETC